MSETVVKLSKVGKAYRFYDNDRVRVLDALGLARWLVWKKDYYRNFWALKDIDLTLNRGERVGIVGRNGAGKSTLIKIMVGALAASQGSVEVSGEVQAMLELGTGFHPEFTGRQNLRASLAYLGLSPAEVKAKEEEIIDFAELGDFIDHPFKTYSSGMQARLAFSSASSVEPEILVIDEVLGAGDAYFTGKCMERMRALTEGAGVTVVMVSHDMQSILSLAERVLWVHDGKIIDDGEPLRVVKAYRRMMNEYEEERLRRRDGQKKNASIAQPPAKPALPPAGAPPADKELEAELEQSGGPVDTFGAYGDGEARIIGLRLLDHKGRDTRVLQSGRPAEVVFDFQTDSEIINPVFVFCVYLTSGETATQWIVSAAECGLASVRGRGRISFKLERLHLGAAFYVATAAIYRRLRGDGREAEAYHALDRALHFEVVQPLTLPHSRGLCLQPFSASLNQEPPRLIEPWNQQFLHGGGSRD